VTHTALGVVPGVLLAIVFLAAAAGKLTDPVGTREAVANFGVPEALRRPVAAALPAAELAVTTLLLFGSTRMAGAAGALGLLALFSAAIAANLARGRTPECHCFGQLHSAPLDWRMLARNAVLGGLAVVILVPGSGDPGPSVFGWTGTLSPIGIVAVAAGLAAGGLALAGGLAFVALMRSHGRLLVRLDALQRSVEAAGIDVPGEEAVLELGRDPGSPAPAFTADTADGQRVSLTDLLEPGLPLLLAFTSPSCGPCRALLPTLARWQQDHAATLTIAVISDGEPAAIRAEQEDHGLGSVLMDPDFTVYGAYQAIGTPSAVLVSPDGRIASYVAPGAEAIEELLARSLDGEAEPHGLPIGALAPALDLRDLDGNDVRLADPDGRDTLVVFWNPGCGFCNSILDDLRGWERTVGADAPRMVVVSSGDQASSRAEDFQATVALDSGYTAGDAFGAGGTPMAVMLDGDGRIASALAAGGPGVLALAASHRNGRAKTRIEVTR
jgi:peroxiredoxin